MDAKSYFLLAMHVNDDMQQSGFRTSFELNELLEEDLLFSFYLSKALASAADLQ
jgi:hypothetical protein